MTVRQRLADLRGQLDAKRKRGYELNAKTELTDAEQTELRSLNAECADLMGRIATEERALAAEPNAPDLGSSEGRELRSLHQKANVGEIVQAATKREAPAGATRELQEHYQVGAHSIPVAMLLEHRAAASTGIPDARETDQQETEQPVWPTPTAEAANIQRVMVPVGQSIFPTVSAPTSGPDSAAEGATVADTTITIGGAALTPKRIQMSATYSVEDAAIFPMLDGEIREVLRGGIEDGLDRLALNATDGLLSVGDPDDSSSEETFATYIAAAHGRVDGRYANEIGQVALLCGTETYAHMAKTYQTTPLMSALDVLRRDLRSLLVSAQIAKAASDVQQAVFSMGRRRNAVQPVWPSMEVIYDPFSESKDGNVRLTFLALANIAITRAAGFKRVGFKIAT